MNADSEPKISDLKKLRRRCTLRKNTHERRRRGFGIRRRYSLHFKKDRMGGPSGDLTRMLMEKSTESCRSARYRQVRRLHHLATELAFCKSQLRNADRYHTCDDRDRLRGELTTLRSALEGEQKVWGEF